VSALSTVHKLTLEKKEIKIPKKKEIKISKKKEIKISKKKEIKMNCIKIYG
jgi:hypothetical protein